MNAPGTIKMKIDRNKVSSRMVRSTIVDENSLGLHQVSSSMFTDENSSETHQVSSRKVLQTIIAEKFVRYAPGFIKNGLPGHS